MDKISLMKTITQTILSLFLIIGFISCSHHEEEHESHGHEGNFQKIQRLSNHDSIKINASVAHHLAMLKTVPVDTNFVGKVFSIPERKSHIKSFNCTECHSKPLTEMQKMNPKYKSSHWNIELKHANSHAMECVTCHTANNMDELHSLTGKTISFDQSYQVCAQCHSQQFNDWKGGAHGKRLGGWAEPVVKNGCVNCHNPHRPGFGKLMPKSLNTKVTEQRRGY